MPCRFRRGAVLEPGAIPCQGASATRRRRLLRPGSAPSAGDGSGLAPIRGCQTTVQRARQEHVASVQRTFFDEGVEDPSDTATGRISPAYACGSVARTDGGHAKTTPKPPRFASSSHAGESVLIGPKPASFQGLRQITAAPANPRYPLHTREVAGSIPAAPIRKDLQIDIVRLQIWHDT